MSGVDPSSGSPPPSARVRWPYGWSTNTWPDPERRTHMSETLTRYWWAVVLRGVAAVLFGLLALIWPNITVFALVVLFGAYALVDGVLALVAAATGENRGRRGWLILA